MSMLIKLRVSHICQLSYDFHDIVIVVRECMEVVTICMALSGGHLENNLLNETWWQDTALFLMIDCPNPQVSLKF